MSKQDPRLPIPALLPVPVKKMSNTVSITYQWASLQGVYKFYELHKFKHKIILSLDDHYEIKVKKTKTNKNTLLSALDAGQLETVSSSPQPLCKLQTILKLSSLEVCPSHLTVIYWYMSYIYIYIDIYRYIYVAMPLSLPTCPLLTSWTQLRRFSDKAFLGRSALLYQFFVHCLWLLLVGRELSLS